MSYELRDVTPDEWIHAMEHDYRQARGTLLRDPEPGNPAFCCLGVLCDLRGYPRDELRGRGTWPESVSRAAYAAGGSIYPDYSKYDAYPDWLVDMAVERGMVSPDEIRDAVDPYADGDRQRYQLRDLVLSRLMSWNDDSLDGFPLERLREFYGSEEQA